MVLCIFVCATVFSCHHSVKCHGDIETNNRSTNFNSSITCYQSTQISNFFLSVYISPGICILWQQLLRISPLIQSLIVCKFIDITPRQKFNRITNLPKIKWGTTFAVYSIYACIGISYSIISPLISIFIIFFLNLSILYYKYALKYVYSHINESETTGRLYPTALLHLYTGVYCLECCLIGVFPSEK